MDRHTDGKMDGWIDIIETVYSKTCLKQPSSKRPKIGFQELSLKAGQKYCRMLKGEHSAILSTFIQLASVIKIFVLSIFEWPFYTGFTVSQQTMCLRKLPSMERLR